MNRITTTLATLTAVLAFTVLSADRADALSDSAFKSCLKTIPESTMASMSEGFSVQYPDLWYTMLTNQYRSDHGVPAMRELMRVLGC